MKACDGEIRYEELEEELKEALRAEELYNLQNDAKFRAIEQSVPTYEDFSQMVKAAHLRPLDRKDMKPNIGVKWNCLADWNANANLAKQRLKIDNQRSVMQVSVKTVPPTSHEFLRVWKGLIDRTDKYRLLKESRHVLRSKIFRSEIPPDILTDCLIACLESLKLHESENYVIDILTELGGCNRFELAVKFMSKSDKNVCEELFKTLRQAGRKNDDVIDNLEKKYFP